jgi:1-acyl-sn-glycerol-3-phosphate acyltransferase
MTDEITVAEFIAKQPDYDKNRRILYPFLRFIVPLFCKVEVTGLENIPRDGQTCIMINHISNLDPIAVTYAIPFRYVISLSKRENFSLPLLGWLFKKWGIYPINRGEIDRKALTQTIELMKSGQLVLMAPEGTRHPEGLAHAKEGLAYIASKTDVVIVPTAISGAQDWLSRLKRFRRAYVRLNFGKPFKFKVEGRKRIPREELSLMIQEAMYQLSSTIPEEYADGRGVYSNTENATTDHIEFV